MKSTCAHLILLICLTSNYSFAATDYNRMRKDISVMSQIIRGAFDDEADCRRCRVKVEGSYLAEQGAIFTITPSQIHFRIGAGGSDRWEGFDNWEFTSMDDLAEIPAMVTEILAEIDIDLGGGRRYGTRGGDERIIDRESRGRMRALSREKRHLEEEMRDIEIGLIHAEDEEREEQEERLAEIGRRVESLQEKRQKLDELLEQRRSDQKKRRLEEQDKVASRVLQRLLEFENLILATFCDYGTNLKSVPEDEHVTVILQNTARSQSSPRSKIYVFKKKDLVACQGDSIASNELKQRAIVYNF